MLSHCGLLINKCGTKSVFIILAVPVYLKKGRNFAEHLGLFISTASRWVLSTKVKTHHQRVGGFLTLVLGIVKKKISYMCTWKVLVKNIPSSRKKVAQHKYTQPSIKVKQQNWFFTEYSRKDETSSARKYVYICQAKKLCFFLFVFIMHLNNKMYINLH